VTIEKEQQEIAEYKERIRTLQEQLQKKNEKIDLEKLFCELGRRKIDSILVEGGGEINFSVLEKKLADCIYAFIAPKIFGGTAKTPVAGAGIEHPADAFKFKLKNIKHFDEDILLELTKN